MPFRPPPPGLNDSYSGGTLQWTPRGEHSSSNEDADDPTPAGGSATALSPDDQEIADQYMKMIKMGMPEGAVANKMTQYGVGQHIQDVVLAPEPEPEPRQEPQPPDEKPKVEEEHQEAAEVGKLTDGEEEIAAKYKVMLKMGMPEGAVMQKMTTDEVPQKIQDAVLAPPPPPPPPKEPEPQPEAEAQPPMESKPQREEPAQEGPTATLTEEEEEMVNRYRKMLKMGMPEGAVTQKMIAEEAPQNVQNAVLAPSEDKIDEDESEEKTPKTMVAPMTNAVVAATTVAANPEGSFPDQQDEEIPLKPEPKKSKPKVVPAPPIGGSMPNLEEEGSQEFDLEGDLAAAMERSGETLYEEISDSDFEEEEMLEDIDEEEEGFDGVSGDDPDALEDLAMAGESRQAPDVITDENSVESALVSQSSATTQAQAAPQDPIPENRDVETGDVFDDEDVVLDRTPLVSPKKRKEVTTKNPDGCFHFAVFVFYVLIIGAGVSASLYFILREEDATPLKSVSEQGFMTTPFDSIDASSCDFSGVTWPHALDQCRCTGEISIIANDVKTRYARHVNEFIPILYENYEESISSCTARNQALVWLSTANDHEFDEAQRSERFALANLFIAMGGIEWNSSTGWLSETSVCEWFGVTCEDGTTKSISLASNGVFGKIPDEVLSIRKLSLLSLERNTVTGTIPDALFFLPLLDSLFLNNNKLTGSIPASIQEATALKTFQIQVNTLDGTIPEEIDAATSLQIVNLSDNRIRGTIPGSLFSLSSLEEIDLTSNRLGGSIPDSIALASSLRLLDVSSNLLVGSIPAAITTLTRLERLRLENLSLDGRLPGSLGSLSNLLELSIIQTDVDGPLPTSMVAMTKLETLALAANKLTGTIPTDIGRLSLLRTLDLSGNSFSGPLNVNLSELTQIAQMHLNDNDLTGGFPPAIGKLSSLESMRLDGNILQGEVAAEICSLRDESLIELVVDCPAIECSIPECCTSCRR